MLDGVSHHQILAVGAEGTAFCEEPGKPLVPLGVIGGPGVHDAQAEALEAHGIEFDHVISLEIADEAIVKRMDGRRVCTHCGTPFHVESKPPRAEGICDLCGGELTERDDDRPETVRARLVVYHEETEPLKHFYEKRGKLDTVPGDLGTIEDTTRAIKQVLEASH